MNNFVQKIKIFVARESQVFLLLIISILFSAHLFAQQNISIEQITVADGLPENSVRSIIQDKYGFLWLGTQNGLVKYDGYNFTIFQHDPEDAKSLSNNFVVDIIEDDENNIWVGCNFNGLNKLDRKTETFTRYTHNPENPNSISDNAAITLYIDKEKNYGLVPLKAD